MLFYILLSPYVIQLQSPFSWIRFDRLEATVYSNFIEFFFPLKCLNLLLQLICSMHTLFKQKHLCISGFLLKSTGGHTEAASVLEAE